MKENEDIKVSQRPIRRPDRYLTSVKEFAFLSEDEIEVTATSGLPNRLNEVLPAASLKSENYMANPIVLWSHDWEQPPIGKTTAIRAEGNKMIHRITFASHPFAQQIKQLYQGGFLNAWSYGFVINNFEDNEKAGIRTITDAEMLELSAVNVPADAKALSNKSLCFYGLLPGIEVGKELRLYGAIPYKETSLADMDAEWDGGAEIAAASVEDLAIMCAWYDADYPNVKSSYKLPHHRAAGDHPVVWKAVVAAGNVLMGARGGVDIPDDDVAAVKAHLEKHYHEFDRDAAWEKEQALSSWGKKIERARHLINELRTGKKENGTDLSMLHEIMCITVDLRGNIGQEKVMESIKMLGMLLGKDDVVTDSIIVGKVIEQLSADWLMTKPDEQLDEVIGSIIAKQRDLRERLNQLKS